MENESPTPTITTIKKKPTSVFSLLGFSFSLIVLLLLWLTQGVIIISDNKNLAADPTTFDLATDPTAGTGDPTFGLVMLSTLICVPLGILGFIFSIKGVLKADQNGTSKWMGICGLIFCFLCVLSLFIPIIVEIMLK